MSTPRNLTLCGVTVPFDGTPRFAEVEAYDQAMQGGQTRVIDLLRALAPVIINTRLPQTPEWAMQPHTPITEDCGVSVLEVVRAIVGALDGPKVMAALKAMSTPAPSTGKKSA